MDINTLRGISTIFVMIAFLGVCWWAFSPKRKKGFEDAANLPFADEDSSLQSNALKSNSLKRNAEQQGGSSKDLHSSSADDASEERQD